MNSDTSNATNEVTVSWAGDDPPWSTSTVTVTRCRKPLCMRLSTFGSDYCDRHRPNGNLTTDTDLTDINNRPPTNIPGPSRRDLQRQLDRIEGKLDALLNGREYTEDD